MLIDRATIFVRSGKGGGGCVSFRREKFVPKGGPDGGDGGTGGDVILVGDASLSTLLPLTPRPHFRAENGQPGKGRSMHGADGEDRLVRVPPGTLVCEMPDETFLVDIADDGQRYVVAKGGRGGLGNEHFKSATNQTPREATPGEPWVERTLRLELKLIADVGLVGLPNAGKSTLLTAVSRARPKIADYPFTTISPHLGIASLSGERRIIVADIPGLIEGAAEGAGLGHAFLRHVERTKLLVHLLDAVPIDGSLPEDNYRTVCRELAGHDPALARKPQIVVLGKIDLVPVDERAMVVDRVRRSLGFEADEPMMISGATGEGVADLLERCWVRLGKQEPGWAAQP